MKRLAVLVLWILLCREALSLKIGSKNREKRSSGCDSQGCGGNSYSLSYQSQPSYSSGTTYTYDPCWSAPYFGGCTSFLQVPLPSSQSHQIQAPSVQVQPVQPQVVTQPAPVVPIQTVVQQPVPTISVPTYHVQQVPQVQTVSRPQTPIFQQQPTYQSSSCNCQQVNCNPVVPQTIPVTCVQTCCSTRQLQTPVNNQQTFVPAPTVQPYSVLQSSYGQPTPIVNTHVQSTPAPQPSYALPPAPIPYTQPLRPTPTPTPISPVRTYTVSQPVLSYVPLPSPAPIPLPQPSPVPVPVPQPVPQSGYVGSSFPAPQQNFWVPPTYRPGPSPVAQVQTVQTIPAPIPQSTRTFIQPQAYGNSYNGGQVSTYSGFSTVPTVQPVANPVIQQQAPAQQFVVPQNQPNSYQTYLPALRLVRRRTFGG
ncbi:hypothetical protein WR25_24694 [Diploscapter pachys]|uniref:Uncharacterized protein n=1 Tax=Diploscapter pachys TaxID=2018661 RepID=A0A2A2L5I3_9BILA|nr:hypothetical protein WR25_24694 [Diploscapter pachys]